jgi:hypothetical protein
MPPNDTGPSWIANAKRRGAGAGEDQDQGQRAGRLRR